MRWALCSHVIWAFPLRTFEPAGCGWNGSPIHRELDAYGPADCAAICAAITKAWSFALRQGDFGVECACFPDPAVRARFNYSCKHQCPDRNAICGGELPSTAARYKLDYRAGIATVKTGSSVATFEWTHVPLDFPGETLDVPLLFMGLSTARPSRNDVEVRDVTQAGFEIRLRKRKTTLKCKGGSREEVSFAAVRRGKFFDEFWRPIVAGSWHPTDGPLRDVPEDATVVAQLQEGIVLDPQTVRIRRQGTEVLFLAAGGAPVNYLIVSRPPPFSKQVNSTSLWNGLTLVNPEDTDEGWWDPTVDIPEGFMAVGQPDGYIPDTIALWRDRNKIRIAKTCNDNLRPPTVVQLQLNIVLFRTGLSYALQDDFAEDFSCNWDSIAWRKPHGRKFLPKNRIWDIGDSLVLEGCRLPVKCGYTGWTPVSSAEVTFCARTGSSEPPPRLCNAFNLRLEGFREVYRLRSIVACVRDERLPGADNVRDECRFALLGSRAEANIWALSCGKHRPLGSY